jgi:hypothetical protein
MKEIIEEFKSGTIDGKSIEEAILKLVEQNKDFISDSEVRRLNK